MIHNVFLAYAKEIEKDKLLYFSLSFNQAPIIIKALNDNKEQKRFLGYEWSNRKGDEGLKELHSPYLSPLFERDNPHNPNKLAHLIRQAFLEISSPIPQDLSPYAFKTKLIAMLDFSKVDFNKAISLNPTNSQGKGKRPASFEDTNGTYNFYKSSLEIFKCTTYDFDTEAIIIGDGGTANIHYYKGKFSATDHAYIFERLNDEISLHYIYFVIRNNLNLLQAGFKGIGLQNIAKKFIKEQIKIPLPPLEIQKQIVSECERIEEQYSTIRMSIEKYQELIRAILVKCGICHTERELVSTNTESNPVILSNSEKSKNKLDFSPFSKAQNDNFQALLDSLPTPPPQGWERVKLGQVVSVQSGGTPSREVAEYWNGDINWIKSEVCQNCYVYENQVKEKIAKLGLKKLSAKILKKDSVLIALVGATIGKVGYLTFDSTTNQNIAGLYPLNSENLNTKFLYFACLGLYHLFTEKGGFTMANLTFIKNLKIPLPPLEAQESIVQAIESVENEITKLKEQSKTFESKKAEILKSFL